jgi:hypothetical protein
LAWSSSGLNYVNVQPGKLLDLPASGDVRASIDGKGLIPAMNREDLAEFMVEQIVGSEWDCQSVVVGYWLDRSPPVDERSAR